MAALDLRVPFDVCQEAFGVPGSVTRPAPDDTPIISDVVWVAEQSDQVPGTAEFQRKKRIGMLAISKADVPTVPLHTIVEAPEVAGGEAKLWSVESTDRIEVDHVRVRVRPIARVA